MLKRFVHSMTDVQLFVSLLSLTTLYFISVVVGVSNEFWLIKAGAIIVILFISLGLWLIFKEGKRRG